MANPQDEAIASGARHVDETEHLLTGTEEGDPQQASENGIESGPVETELHDLTLSMFLTGDQVRVRAGSPYNPASSYEGIFDSAEDANNALLDAGVLEPQQVPKRTELLGTGIALASTTAEKLVEAGLKHNHNASM